MEIFLSGLNPNAPRADDKLDITPRGSAPSILSALLRSMPLSMARFSRSASVSAVLTLSATASRSSPPSLFGEVLRYRISASIDSWYTRSASSRSRDCSSFALSSPRRASLTSSTVKARDVPTARARLAPPPSPRIRAACAISWAARSLWPTSTFRRTWFRFAITGFWHESQVRQNNEGERTFLSFCRGNQYRSGLGITNAESWMGHESWCPRAAHYQLHPPLQSKNYTT